jgi:hypothetical protein
MITSWGFRKLGIQRDSDTHELVKLGIQTPMNSSVGPTGQRTRSWSREAV